MQLTVSRPDLLDAINRVIGGVEKRQTMPILGNLLLEVDADQLKLTGTDLEIQLESECPVDAPQPGRTTVNARKLHDIIRAIPAESQIVIRQEEGFVIVQAGHSVFRLACLPADEYPRMEATTEEHRLVLGQDRLRAMLDKTQFSMAQQDVRYFLNGLLFEVSPERIRCVATDGHRLALAETDSQQSIEETLRIIVPRKMVMELMRALDRDDNSPVELLVSTQQIELKLAHQRMVSKLIDGRFPDYERVIPKNNSKQVHVDRETLKQVLQRASVLNTDRFAGAHYHLQSDRLAIEAINSDQESSREEIPVHYQGDDLKIAFNISYMLAILSHVDDMQVRMDFETPESSALILPTDEDAIRTRYVLMPMKI
ncbi:DNA polymerase III subunit beta [Guyparkeria sp. SCN-R1]|uniref:DNA polymerase III subunit beta n=1 Tax=Guyparkeria sp. SCN-R1 TaxID=2341113 RepID=UPI000F64DE95|nr:DNA polymerase III subunit beta [Guyparkeria sp. SCN-R1]RRQ23177.1 DNA polymerase III subunit beta [Guyparkeria sp. SCN-R1]